MAKKKTNSLFATIDSNTANNTTSETSLSASVENIETKIIESDDLI